MEVTKKVAQNVIESVLHMALAHVDDAVRNQMRISILVAQLSEEQVKYTDGAKLPIVTALANTPADRDRAEACALRAWETREDVQFPEQVTPEMFEQHPSLGDAAAFCVDVPHFGGALIVAVVFPQGFWAAHEIACWVRDDIIHGLDFQKKLLNHQGRAI